MKQQTRLWKKPDTPRPVKPYKPDAGEPNDRLNDAPGIVTYTMYCFRLIYHIILFKDRFYKYGL
jgi:hypothetical protein